MQWRSIRMRCHTLRWCRGWQCPGLPALAYTNSSNLLDMAVGTSCHTNSCNLLDMASLVTVLHIVPLADTFIRAVLVQHFSILLLKFFFLYCAIHTSSGKKADYSTCLPHIIANSSTVSPTANTEEWFADDLGCNINRLFQKSMR